MLAGKNNLFTELSEFVWVLLNFVEFIIKKANRTFYLEVKELSHFLLSTVERKVEFFHLSGSSCWCHDIRFRWFACKRVVLADFSLICHIIFYISWRKLNNLINTKKKFLPKQFSSHPRLVPKIHLPNWCD